MLLKPYLTVGAAASIRAFCLILILVAAGPAHAAAPGGLSADIEGFIGEMTRQHQFDEADLRRLFARVKPAPAVVRAMSAPSTARPWHEFRARIVDSARVQGGLAYWRRHETLLDRASREFGVPPEIIVATIGIETLYGKHTGRFRVLEALTMLAFYYPPRAELFRSELESYLLLARESGFDPMSVRGSYAGAIGIPQFLPSSLRRYAVDFDRDGKRELSGSADAIGSVANYYRVHGWRNAAPVIVDVAEAGEDAEALLAMGIKPELTVSELAQRGVRPDGPVDAGARAALIKAEAENGPRYWLGLENFYVITRYNRSVNYALAVHELSRELRSGFSAGR